MGTANHIWKHCGECNRQLHLRDFYYADRNRYDASCRSCQKAKFSFPDSTDYCIGLPEYAAITDVPKEALLRMANNGEIDSATISKELFFSRCDIASVIETYERLWKTRTNRNKEADEARRKKEEEQRAALEKLNAMAESGIPAVVRNAAQGQIVYFIHAKGSEKVKIGVTSKSPKARMQSLQTGSPVPLTLMGYVPEKILGMSEIQVHAKFHGLRAHGEWFYLDKDLAEFIFKSLKKKGATYSIDDDAAAFLLSKTYQPEEVNNDLPNETS